MISCVVLLPQNKILLLLKRKSRSPTCGPSAYGASRQWRRTSSSVLLAVTVPVVAIAYEAALRPSIRLKVRSSPDASFLTKYLKNVFRTIEKAGLTSPIFEADRVVKAKRVEN